MKHILSLLTPFLLCIASCSSGQPEKEPLPEAGIYVSMVKTEQCSIADTLALKLLHTKRLYRVSRKIGLWVTRLDTNQCIRYNRTQWPAVYDENTHKLQGTDERPVIHYDPDNNSLTISGETYTKIDSHVSN